VRPCPDKPPSWHAVLQGGLLDGFKEAYEDGYAAIEEEQDAMRNPFKEVASLPPLLKQSLHISLVHHWLIRNLSLAEVNICNQGGNGNDTACSRLGF